MSRGYMNMNERLKQILLPAYKPCQGFSDACQKMRWRPEQGHVPRGFLGATGSIEDVELVLVFAEPGDPHFDEVHSGIDTAYCKAMKAFSEGTDLFHRNVRHILNMCWPDISFEEQLRRTWMTESVLCSAPQESGPVSSLCSRYCANMYLIPQLQLFNGCVVGALGAKARDRLKAAGVKEYIPAIAAAPPGCNLSDAESSWRAIADAVHKRNIA